VEIFKTGLSGFFFTAMGIYFFVNMPKVLGMFLIGYALGRSVL
jgi:hypothetical protein